MDKKLFRTLVFVFSLFTLPVLTAAAAETAEPDSEYTDLVTSITQVTAPYIKGDYLIFTAKPDSRFVGIAFDFEEFNKVHPYMKHNTYDENGEVEKSIFFYALKLSKNMQEIRYRIVVDGLWTLDSTNSDKIYDDRTGIQLSRCDVRREIPPATEVLPNRVVRFVYKGESGRQIRLGGTFTNWDSWIYEMKEVQPGLYQFDLSLPPGTYQYSYYTGVNVLVDTTNPERCYTKDGKIASQLTVN